MRIAFGSRSPLLPSLYVVGLLLLAPSGVAPVLAGMIDAPGLPSASQPTPQGEVDSIMAHIRKREYDRALALATELTRTRPGDSTAHTLQGAAYFGKRDLANARRSFDKAVAIDPSNNQALIYLAQLDVEEKKPAAATKRYEQILARDPKYMPALIGMGQLEAAQNNGEQALAWYRRAVDASPDALPPRLYLGRYYLQIKDFSAAIRELTDAARTHAESAEVLDLLAEAQLGAGRGADAVASYRKLVAVRPDSAVAYYRLGLAQIQQKAFPDAEASVRKAIELQPGFVDAIYVLAGLETRAGRNDEALKLARGLQTSMPKSSAGFSIEGDVRTAEGRHADAIKAYAKALEIGKTTPLAIKLHAAQVSGGQIAEANAQLERWLNEHPKDVYGWQYLADMNARAGRNKLAIPQYERVLKANPNDAHAMNNLASLYHQANDPRALRLAEQAYRLMPDSPAIADTLGWIRVEQGNVAPGLELLREALQKDPKNSVVRYHLAAALAKSGNKTEARKQLEGLLADEQAFPQREAALQLLKQL